MSKDINKVIMKNVSLQALYEQISIKEPFEIVFGPAQKTVATYFFEKMIKDMLDDRKKAEKMHKVKFIKQENNDIFIEYKVKDDEVIKFELYKLLRVVNFTHITLSAEIVNTYANNSALFKDYISFDGFKEKIKYAGESFSYLNRLEYGDMLAINIYTDLELGGYRNMNRLLKNEYKANLDHLPETLLHVAVLSSALNKIPNNETAEYLVRYQGASCLSEWLDSKFITVKSFSSASVVPQEYFNKGATGVKIIYKDVPAVGIEPLSCNPSEKEFLIKPSTQLLITGCQNNDTGNFFTVESYNSCLQENIVELNELSKIIPQEIMGGFYDDVSC